MIDTSPVDKAVLFEAAREGNLDLIKRIAENTGTNLNELDDDGSSPLHYAASSDSRAAAEYLINRCSFSPLFGNKRGITPYDIAYEEGNEAILKLFEEITGFRYCNSYHNPVQRGFFPDPSVIRVGDDYYMVNSTFHFFPCIPISHSTDLVHWRIIGYAITDRKWSRLDDKAGGRGYWAPDISYSDGRFYITATLRGNDGAEEKRVQMVTSSVNPEGPYDEPAWISEDGIDPSIFHDTDGRKYMLLNRGARIFELSSDCRRKISEAELLWLGESRKNPEGPHILKKNGYYYLFLAEGGTGRGHMVTCARSRELLGVYEPCPYNPILKQYDDKQLLQCCGHGMLVSSPDGDWYIAYLALRYSEDGLGFIGRESCLDKVTWTSDGWPLVNDGNGPSVLSERPEDTGSVRSFRSDYCLPHWNERDWMTPRPIDLDDVFISSAGLHLRGKGYDFNEIECRSAMLERQREFAFEASAEFIVPSLEDSESIGILSYYDENSFIEFGIGKSDGMYFLVLRAFAGDSFIYDERVRLGEKPDAALLKVRASGSRREFIYGEHSIVLEDTSYLASEGLKKGKRFTGAAIGIYVKGRFEGIFRDWSISFGGC